MTAPVQPDPRPSSRPEPAGGPKFWASLEAPEIFSTTLAGAVTVGAGKATFTNTTGETLQISNVRLHAGTAPAGADLIVDVNAAGASVFSAAGRPRLVAGSADGSAVPDVNPATVAPNEQITVDVDQVGSGTAGSDLTITVEGVKVGTGGFAWQQLRDGLVRTPIRNAELLPVDVNADAEQAAPPA